MKEKLNVISDIEDLIIKNKLEDAILMMKSIFDDIGDESLVNESLLLLNRINNLQNKANNGIIDYFDPEFGKVRFSTITLKSSARKALELRKQNIGITNFTKERLLENLVFEDNFLNNNNDWLVGDKNSYKAEIRNGRFFIERFDNKELFDNIHQKIKINELENFTIKTRIHFLKGSKEYGFGVNFGHSEDGKSLFRFLINADGSFCLNYYIDGEEFSIVSWTENPVIQTGVNINTIDIEKSNELLHFKINKEVVYTSEFMSFFGDGIGFYIHNNIKIAVEYIKVTN